MMDDDHSMIRPKNDAPFTSLDDLLTGSVDDDPFSNKLPSRLIAQVAARPPLSQPHHASSSNVGGLVTVDSSSNGMIYTVVNSNAFSAQQPQRNLQQLLSSDQVPVTAMHINKGRIIASQQQQSLLVSTGGNIHVQPPLPTAHNASHQQQQTLFTACNGNYNHQQYIQPQLQHDNSSLMNGGSLVKHVAVVPPNRCIPQVSGGGSGTAVLVNQQQQQQGPMNGVYAAVNGAYVGSINPSSLQNATRIVTGQLVTGTPSVHSVQAVTQSSYNPNVVPVQQSPILSQSSSQPPSNSNNSNSMNHLQFEPHKKHLIQRQLILLLHATKCRKQDNNQQCETAHCSTMRNVLLHMSSCVDGKNCSTPHCASSKQIISHWKSCVDRQCGVCEPLKKQINNHSSLCSGVGSGTAGASGFASVPLASVQCAPVMGGATVHHTGNGNPPQMNVLPSSLPATTLNNPPVPNGLPPTSLTEGEVDWRSTVSKGQRQHLVRRIVQTIFPAPDKNAYSDERMQSLIEYATKVENENYNSAKSREEYFHKLAERCYKINKELEEKRKARNALISSANSASNGADPHFANSNASSLSQPPQSQDGMQSQYRSNDIPSSVRNELGSDEACVPRLDVPSVSDQENLNQFDNALQKEYQRNSSDQNAVKESPTELVLTASSSMASVKSEPMSVTVKPSKASPQPPTSTPATAPSYPFLKKWTREELCRNFLTLYRIIQQQEDALPFLEPVDPVLLNIPDYHTIIKNPMDLRTIQEKLERGVYQDPWEVVNDFWLMFNNAWLYNKKNTKVYRSCTKLAEIFEKNVDKYMHTMGMCCGQDYLFLPQVLYCNTQNMCTINREANYYYYEKRNEGSIFEEKYYICEKCFMDESTGKTIGVYADLNQDPIFLEKELFESRKNNVKERETFVNCRECGRKWHQICALHLEEIWTEGFICHTCLSERPSQTNPGVPRTRRANPFTSKKLPNTKLGAFLEKRVNDFLLKKNILKTRDGGEVTIRVLYSGDKSVEVKSLMKQRFCDSGNMAEHFPYRTKAIFAFQEIDGVEVCFFGLHVQEYDSSCPTPNQRRVYVSYLDSVFYFRPKQYRTDVYHEILIGYLQYVKELGYAMAHIWACPPSEGDDYIFHMHPQDQKMPKPKRLQEWYQKMLKKACVEGIVVACNDIYSDAINNKIDSPADIPYFDGDFWSSTLEDLIKEVDEMKLKRAVEEEVKQEPDDDDEDDNPHNLGDMRRSTVTKKNKKRKGNKKSALVPTKRKKFSGKVFPPKEDSELLMNKVFIVMEKHKEVFFHINLHSQKSVNDLRPIDDPDPYISTWLMDGRDNFLMLAREKHMEFSSLRRAKFSTLVMLYELHSGGRNNNFSYQCNGCGVQLNSHYHCLDCAESYDLCQKCFDMEIHPHKMKYKQVLKLESEDAGVVPLTGASTVAGVPGSGDISVQEARRVSIERCIKSLTHACSCRDANCRMNACQKMKNVLIHMRNCDRKANGTCSLCKQLIALCCYHAKYCTEPTCSMPFCQNIKYRWKQQQQQQRMMTAQNLRRRIEIMQTSSSHGEHPHSGTHSSSASASASASSGPSNNPSGNASATHSNPNQTPVAVYLQQTVSHSPSMPPSQQHRSLSSAANVPSMPTAAISGSVPPYQKSTSLVQSQATSQSSVKQETVASSYHPTAVVPQLQPNGQVRLVNPSQQAVQTLQPPSNVTSSSNNFVHPPSATPVQILNTMQMRLPNVSGSCAYNGNGGLGPPTNFPHPLSQIATMESTPNLDPVELQNRRFLQDKIAQIRREIPIQTEQNKRFQEFLMANQDYIPVFRRMRDEQQTKRRQNTTGRNQGLGVNVSTATSGVGASSGGGMFSLPSSQSSSLSQFSAGTANHSSPLTGTVQNYNGAGGQGFPPLPPQGNLNTGNVQIRTLFTVPQTINQRLQVVRPPYGSTSEQQ